ncbi:MAG: menaquinone-dependent protoporphyrinogen IX dehydrogenase [Methylicorpusculum sp.]|uniref:menaquinone-dependent protoporphyrinogen IX dehydrogenase n=1 Tax=Methylicorpusculum sp. TaxID=2713644 RepID=UPI00271CD07E|nr:menaquinone-dependent protoporphyrinogen IX dehydrogenase [Methylicorpusculum sp.]MDO8938034.1 menaquinone-dependent protoporphyrinogen IX dehydrogenase [Methylicorpusculum sp.]MDP2178712.1 menaquinone-dependent protoporphyrinogen IX dehydrogenase [Methylicorpusculum sp.]MDP2201014.1 menaquinone-dependent protoporphyrinogen IX dehydrogenase [Methylicorpusculum sp.]MDP3527966.1 menaquinone-dependent protoporphyrinogen IX dehydrogenase [Methylicorpusculum sp.]MDZ4150153.1 menaquinone-dependen
MAKILIVYSSIDGHTQKICQRLQQVIEQQSHQVTVVSVNEAPQVDLTVFDKIVVGGSVHYGKHSPLIVDFINKNKPILESKPNAFFSVNLVARKPEKCIPGNNPYLQKFLKRITWKPKELAVFAGKIDYPRYSFFDRLIIQLIMVITKGPTDPKSIIEFTDWQQVKSFGLRISEMG